MRRTFVALLLATSLCSFGQSVKEVKEELIRQGIPCWQVALAQAVHETGWFKSSACRNKHNIFGMTRGKRLKTYPSWRACVSDYKDKISSRYHGNGTHADYYSFLRRIGYASDPKYQTRLRGVIDTLKKEGHL